MQRVGFLIAADQFPNDETLNPLQFSQNDARSFGNVLRDNTVGFVPYYFLNAPHFEVLQRLEKLSSQLNPDDALLVYYAGHGKLSRSGELCLATIDTTTNALSTSSIDATRLLSLMQNSRAHNRILILDCCHSGAVGVKFRGDGVKDSLGSLATSYGTYILTASTSIQLAEERERDGHGVFTKYLIKGLQSGEAAQNDIITVTDLYNYAHTNVVRETSQHPLMWSLKQSGEPFILADFRARQATERAIANNFDIEREDGVGIVAALVGRELLIVEGLLMPGHGKMTVTGRLAETSKEMVAMAASYIRSRAVAFGIESPVFDRRDTHLHIPISGDKGDQSIGLAVATVIVSIHTGISIRRDVAMTGGFSLRGRVFPVTDLEPKLLAASKCGIKRVLIPAMNAKDLPAISAEAKNNLEIIPVSYLHEVFKHGLVRMPEPIVWEEAVPMPVDTDAK